MKKIDKLILKAWIGPFLVSFVVILFVLVLQFLSKYIEEIAGKGVEPIVLGKVFVYSCLALVPMALPLGVLLSSLLTMGNMGERYELAALKSSGVSLLKIMRPMSVAAVGITVFSLLFSFYMVPTANLKLFTLLYDLSNVKPTFAIEADHFYTDLDGMVVHVDDIKRGDPDVLYNIKIFDHQGNIGNNRITLAASGTMVPSQTAGWLSLTLVDGVIHEDVSKTDPARREKQPYQRFYFDTLLYKVPLKGYDLEESEENTFGSHHYMKDIHELQESVDSLNQRIVDVTDEMINFTQKYVHVDTTLTPEMRKVYERDTARYGPDGRIEPKLAQEVYTWFPDVPPEELYKKTLHQTRAVKNYSNITKDRKKRETEKIRKFRIEIHNRYMLPVSIMVFLFLGAPLGAIIRKGGIGMPVIVSIVFFILFYIFMMQGKKFARDAILPIWLGVWMPVLVMIPMAIFFTIQSTTDSALMSSQLWWKIWRALTFWWPFKRKKKAGPGTLSIEQLIEAREKQKEKARRAMEEYQEEEAEKQERKENKAKGKGKGKKDANNATDDDGEKDEG